MKKLTKITFVNRATLCTSARIYFFFFLFGDYSVLSPLFLMVALGTFLNSRLRGHQPARDYTRPPTHNTTPHTTHHNGRTIQGSTPDSLQLNTRRKHRRNLPGEDYHAPAPRHQEQKARRGTAMKQDGDCARGRHPRLQASDTLLFSRRRGSLPSRLGSKASNHRT
jgi:hypothetical protein